MKTKLLTIICMAVMLTACSNADSSTAVTTPAGQTTTTTTTTTEATETESKTDSQTSEDETVTSETTTTPAQTEEPTITTTTPEEITTTTTTNAKTLITEPKVTTTTKKSTTTKKQTTTTKVTTTKPKTTTTTAKKTTTTTTTTTKKVEQPPEGRVMYSCGAIFRSDTTTKKSNTKICEIPMDTKIIVITDVGDGKDGKGWYKAYYNEQYGYVTHNSVSSLPSSRWDEELCNLINDYRESLGLEKLKIDQRLMEAAQIRLDEQKVSAGHTRPDGSSCFTVFDEVGISDESLGVENLGGGATPQVIFKGWKNSSGHNRNMTYANSVAMGVAFDIERGSWVFLARTAESDE